MRHSYLPASAGQYAKQHLTLPVEAEPQTGRESARLEFPRISVSRPATKQLEVIEGGFHVMFGPTTRKSDKRTVRALNQNQDLPASR